MYEKLRPIFNQQAALAHRQQWRDNLVFSGTRIPGKVPDLLTVLPVENGTIDTQPITVPGHKIRVQLDAYVEKNKVNSQVVAVAWLPIKKQLNQTQ